MGDRVAVVGAGGWGTALSVLLKDKGHDVFLWARDPEYAELMSRKRENERYLPGVRIPEEVKVTSDLSVIGDCSAVVLAVPSHGMREICGKMVPYLRRDHLLLSGAKGIELGSLKRMSEVIREVVGDVVDKPPAAISGPTHAEEVGRRMASAAVVACSDIDVARRFQEMLMGPYFRVYTSRDIVGVELGGSLKNVVAIAVGIGDGLSFGDNARGALITRGLAEIARLGIAMGANPLTFAGLSGMGDLVTTCISKYSRNRWVGEQIGKGRKLEDVLSEMVMVAEGVKTTIAAMELSKKMGIEMPITSQVYEVLFQGKDPMKAVSELMLRMPKEEMIGL
jgi:glycerol-3-phosphate dehydrogenase (NAD(P)+)